MALKRMAEFFDAYVVNSKDIFNADNPLDIPQKPALQNGSKNPVENLEDLVGKLQLGEDGLGQQPQDRSSKASSSRAEFPAVTANSRQRTPSITSKAEGRATTDTKLSDEQFAELLTQGAKIPIDERDKPPPPKQSLVKSKIRMRTRSSKSKKEEREGKEGDKKSKGDSKKGESSSQQAAADPATGAPAKSSTAGVATVEAPRPPAITKAESSDKLRESPSKHQKSLKASTSQPALSSVGLESTLRLSPSRMRLALSRSSKSDSKAPATQPPKSPAKIPTETRKPPRSPTKPTAKSSDTSLGLPAGPTTEALVTPLKSPARASEVTEPPKSSVRSTVEEKVSPPEQHTQTTIQQVATSSNSPAKAPVLTTLPSSPSKTSHKMGKKLQSLSNLPVLGPGDAIAEGDSRIIYNFFPADFKHPSDPSTPLKDVIFQQLYSEIRWQKMLHQTGEVPRLVCCQGEFGADGSMPIYRHPTDQALPLLHFSPRVRTIQKQAEKLVGHPLNHVLIQLYRSGQDFISEHSDKTLDITRGSSIVNISFGAQRTMRLRTKKAERAEEPQETTSRNTQRVAMPHNSMFILGLKSNQQWVHSIQPDKRLPAERSELEEAYGGARISLTFRNISTFLDAEENKIWGQGATSKEQRDAQDVINDDEEENEKVVRAFSRENHQSEFVWDEWYGAGFDVLHFHSPPEDIPILFASPSSVENRMVALFLSETKINHLYLAAPALDRQYEQDRQICYRDNDVNHTQVVNAVPIICYLNQYHAIDHDDRGRACTAASHEIFAILCTLLKFWNKRDEPACLASFVSTAEVLEDRHNHGPGPFIAGRRFSIGDCAIWPALDDIIMNWDGWSEEKFPCLTEYYRMLWKKRKTVTKLRAKLPEIKMTAKGKDEKEDDSLVQMFGNVVIGKRTNEKE